MYTAAPICDEQGQPLAALGLRIRPDDQFTEILHVARPGSSGETYAFDRAGVLLSQSRFDEMLKEIGLLVDRPESQSILSVQLRDPGVNLVDGARATLRRTDQPLTQMASAATQGQDGYDVDGYRDYRGVPVVGAWRWLDEYDFGVATEMDVDEAFAPVYVLRRVFMLLMALLLVAAAGIVLATLLIAQQRRKLRNATTAVRQLGQYTLLEKLGSGGMGTVYKAQHALLRRPTALKLLNPEFMSDTAIARFEREVQLTSGLTHPNTVAIYDYGRTPEGVVYYVMEFLDGINLDELVRRYGPLPEARAVCILRQACASLAEAHEAGLIHRDVKPANIVLTLRGGQHDFVKVLDFGLAKVVASREASVTATNIVAGTPLYVAPEAVLQPEAIDARADVYAIAAVGYFLLTGSPVFGGSSALEICHKHVSGVPEPPSVRAGRPVSSALESLLLRCLSRLRLHGKIPSRCRSSAGRRSWADCGAGIHQRISIARSGGFHSIFDSGFLQRRVGELRPGRAVHNFRSAVRGLAAHLQQAAHFLATTPRALSPVDVRLRANGQCPRMAASMGQFVKETAMLLNFALWCLFGLIAGAIAQFLMPGRDPGQAATPIGFVVTILLGIIGAAVGGIVSSRLFGWDVAGFNLPSLAVAVGGALALLLLYRVVLSLGRGPSPSRR
jgi:uncharacterized membrane protein YeaQ/YmgE (transglycosylase-associated protein family)